MNNDNYFLAYTQINITQNSPKLQYPYGSAQQEETNTNYQTWKIARETKIRNYPKEKSNSYIKKRYRPRRSGIVSEPKTRGGDLSPCLYHRELCSWDPTISRRPPGQG